MRSELFSKAQNLKKKYVNFLYGYGYIFSRTLTNVYFKTSKECKKKNSSEIGFYDAKYQTLILIFATAQKNIFGKVVILHSNQCAVVKFHFQLSHFWKDEFTRTARSFGNGNVLRIYPAPRECFELNKSMAPLHRLSTCAVVRLNWFGLIPVFLETCLQIDWPIRGCSTRINSPMNKHSALEIQLNPLLT